MCLIISGKASKVRSTLLDTHGLLADIYTSNSDGIGFMYGSTSGLRVVKYLPKSLADAQAFIRRIPNDERDFAIHFRYTTHGHTDLLNCHPYDVVPGFVAMMHNGVLHTGNSSDRSKSDTWHFIKDYLASAVRQAPGLVHDKGFLEMVGEFIDNNRFVFMDGDGKMSIVNRTQGVEHDGMWFSNTYAWSPERLIPNYQTRSKYGSRSYRAYSNYGMDDEYDDHYSTWTGSVALHPQEKAKDAPPAGKFSAHDPRWSEDDYNFQDDMNDSQAINEDSYEELDVQPPQTHELVQCMLDADVELLDAWMAQYPMYTIRMLFATMQPTKTTLDSVELLSINERNIYMAAFADDVDEVYRLAATSEVMRTHVCETLCYYMNWVMRVAAKKPIPALLPN